jgi:hypothetical protein
MGVLLNGRLHTLKAMVGKREAKTVQGGDASPRLVGSVLSNIKKNSPLYGVITGALVKKIIAGRSGAREFAGDVILSVSQQPVENVNNLKRALGDNPNQLLLNVRQGNSGILSFCADIAALYPPVTGGKKATSSPSLTGCSKFANSILTAINKLG